MRTHAEPWFLDQSSSLIKQANCKSWKHHKAWEDVCRIWSDDWSKSTPPIAEIASVRIGAVALPAGHQTSTADSSCSATWGASRCYTTHSIAPLASRFGHALAAATVDQLLQTAVTAACNITRIRKDRSYKCWEEKRRKQELHSTQFRDLQSLGQTLAKLLLFSPYVTICHHHIKNKSSFLERKENGRAASKRCTHWVHMEQLPESKERTCQTLCDDISGGPSRSWRCPAVQ